MDTGPPHRLEVPCGTPPDHTGHNPNAERRGSSRPFWGQGSTNLSGTVYEWFLFVGWMQPRRVGFLACGWSLASPQAHGTAIAVQDGNGTILVDAGGDVGKQLARIDGLDSLDRIYLTHEHPDHLWGLAGLVHCLRFTDRERELPIAGPSPALENARAALEALDVTCPFPLEWRPIAVEAGSDDLLRWAPMDHSVPTLGYRIGDVTILGDTAPTDRVIELARECSLMVHEATHTDAARCHASGHSTPGDAANAARRARAGTLALVHIHPSLRREEARRASNHDPTITPVDGDTLRRDGATGSWKREG